MNQDQIVIFCDSQSHRRGKVAKLRVMVRGTAKPAIAGFEPPRWSAVGYRRPGSNVYIVPKSAAVDIVGSVPASVGELAKMGRVNGDRRRVQIECPSCSLSLVVRAERFDRILDVLVDAGVSEISLKALATRLA